MEASIQTTILRNLVRRALLFACLISQLKAFGSFIPTQQNNEQHRIYEQESIDYSQHRNTYPGLGGFGRMDECSKYKAKEIKTEESNHERGRNNGENPCPWFRSEKSYSCP